MRLSIVIGFVCMVAKTLGYSSGPPDAVCASLSPSHRDNTPNTEESPFTILLGSGQYSANGKMTVSLTGTDNDLIKGFLIYARKADGSAPATPIGSFAATGETDAEKVKANCGSGDNTGMSHRQKIDSKTVELEWSAPSTLQGDIEFIYTIVKDFATYWVGKTSTRISEGQATTAVITPQVELTTTLEPSTTTEETPAPQPSHVTSDPSSAAGSNPSTAASSSSNAEVISTEPTATVEAITVEGCGKSKSCYMSDGCTDTDCAYLVSFAKKPDSNKVDFELRVKHGGESQYAAVGIAEGTTMDKVTVIACQANQNGMTTVEHYFAESHSGVAKVNDLSLPAADQNEASIADDMMSCRFTYDNEIAKADTVNFKDLSAGKFYLSVAYGTVYNNMIGKHIRTPVPSPAADLLTTSHSTLGDNHASMVENKIVINILCVFFLFYLIA